MAKTASPLSTAAAILTRATGKTAPATSTSTKAPKVVTKGKTDTKAPAAPTPAPVAAPVNPNPFGPAPTQKGLKLTHAIRDNFRPGSGGALFAHTSVFLTHAGIDKTPMPRATVETFIGARAIKWHTESGNFEIVADRRDAGGKLTQRGGLMLTPKGVETFGKRKPDPELFSAFENVLCRGEMDDRAGVKNTTAIVAVPGVGA